MGEEEWEGRDGAAFPVSLLEAKRGLRCSQRCWNRQPPGPRLGKHGAAWSPHPPPSTRFPSGAVLTLRGLLRGAELLPGSVLTLVCPRALCPRLVSGRPGSSGPSAERGSPSAQAPPPLRTGRRLRAPRAAEGAECRHLAAFRAAGTQGPQPSCPQDPVLPIAPGFPPDLLAEIGPLCTGARFPPNLARRHEGIFVSRPGSCLQPMNLTGGALASRPPGKPLHGLFGERFSTDKRLVEDLTGVSSGSSMAVTLVDTAPGDRRITCPLLADLRQCHGCATVFGEAWV
ncbi:hypothetical protein R6Z07F_013344 [Ovis aries]